MNVLVLFFVLSFSTSLFAEVPVEQRITVKGEAEVKVVPNQFVLQGTVASFDSDLKKATRANDDRVRSLFNGVTKLGVERKYVVTSEIRIESVTEGYRERGNFRFLGYRVTRGVRVVLHDSKWIRPAFNALFSAKIDRLTLSLHHTDHDTVLAQAQMKSATAARKKAGRLASTLGRRLGAAVLISEDSVNSRPTSFTYIADTPNLGDSLSLDKLRISSAVRVTFELL